MAKRRVEDELEQISSLRHAEPRQSVEEQLAKALRDKVNVIVAKAAAVAGELQIVSLLPDLLAAYDRMFQNAVKSDPQCWGKSAIAKALKSLGHAQAAPFLRGSRHVQREPVWGGEEDTAATLRGTCVLALLQCRDVPAHSILSVLVDAAADPAPSVRRDAIQSLEQWGSPETVLLLRMKARLPDEEPAISGMVFDALLRMEGREAADFVASFLDSRTDEIQEEAALALGSSKLEEAVAVLIERCRSERGGKELWFRALGTSRVPAALEFLLEIIRSGRPADAVAGLRALEAQRESAAAWLPISEAVTHRNDAELTDYFEHRFPRPDRE